MDDTGKELSIARRYWIVSIAAAMSLAALVAGIGMIAGGVGIPNYWLDNTPFNSWVLPGVFLILVVAVPQFLALLAVVGSRAPSGMPIAAGVLLIGWIVVEVAWMQQFNILQPVCLAAGVAEVLLPRR